MATSKERRKRSWLCKAGLLLPTLLTGCYGYGLGAHHIDNCATIPPGAIPAPTGTYVNKIRDVQCAKAEADDFVFYKHEWFMGGSDLGPYGRYHINEVVRRLPGVPYPVVIQPTLDNEELNQARYKTILAYLMRAGIPDPETRIVMAFPQAEGLNGDEAERIYNQLMSPSNYANFGYNYTGFGGNRGGYFGGGFFGGRRGFGY